MPPRLPRPYSWIIAYLKRSPGKTPQWNPEGLLMGDAWTFSQMGLDLLRRIGIFQRSISGDHLNGISGQTDLLERTTPILGSR